MLFSSIRRTSRQRERGQKIKQHEQLDRLTYLLFALCSFIRLALNDRRGRSVIPRTPESNPLRELEGNGSIFF